MAERRPRKWTRGLAGNQPRSTNGSTQLRWLQASTYGPAGRARRSWTRTRNTAPSSRRRRPLAARKRSGARTPSECQRELFGRLERVGPDAAPAELLRELLGEAMDRVDLLGPRAADHLQQLVEVAVVRQRERQVGAEDAPEAGVLGPARHQRRAVAAERPDRVLAGGRRHDDAVAGVAVEGHPVGQGHAGQLVAARGRD